MDYNNIIIILYSYVHVPLSLLICIPPGNDQPSLPEYSSPSQDYSQPYTVYMIVKLMPH